MDRERSLENVLGMKGGEGDTSYARVSSLQLRMIETVKPLLESGISQNMNLDILTAIAKKSDGVFRIADLGCATGINTLVVADTIVRAVKAVFIRHSIDEPEFQVYFADLPSNDFNSVLRSLPPRDGEGAGRACEDQEGAEKSCGLLGRPATRSYFAAAVSGSFYKRLFPARSLHFCHSSNSLHWLSQIPSGLEDRSSPAWNGGHIYISSDEVGAAYLGQFRKDFSAFLRARAEEIVPGGCMFLGLPGRVSTDIKGPGTFTVIADHFGAALEVLVGEHVISEEKRDTFNLPMFSPNAEELESIVNMEESFEIAGGVNVQGGFHLEDLDGEEMYARVIAKFYRPVFENIVRAHLGSDDLTDHFFSIIEKNENLPGYLRYQSDISSLTAFLVRKGH